MSDGIRIYLIGGCDGLEPLRDQLKLHGEIDFLGESQHVGQAAPVLAGGHLDLRDVSRHEGRSSRR